MEEIYLYLIAILAGVGATAAVAVTLFYKRKSKNSKEKSKELVQRFISQKAKKYAKTKKEVDRLQKIYEAGEIDEETYERLKAVLLKGKQEKDEEEDVFKYALKKLKK